MTSAVGSDPSFKQGVLVSCLEQPLAEGHQSLYPLRLTQGLLALSTGRGNRQAPRALSPMPALAGVRQCEGGWFQSMRPAFPCSHPAGEGSGR